MHLVPLLALISVSAVAAAQTSAVQAPSPAQNAQGVVVLQASNSSSCPVGLEARHAGDGALVNAGPGAKHPEQEYRITFAPAPDRAVAQARLTLHGISGHHLIPAGETPRAGAEASEAFNVSPSFGAKHLFHSTIYTEKLTGVQWVELNELTYADGTKWQESPTATCRVIPNGYMLVAGSR